MNSDEVNIKQVNHQTRSCQYHKPPAKSKTESQPQVSIEPLSSSNGTLQIPSPKVEVIPKIPKGPLCWNTTSIKVAHTYSIVNDLVQYLFAMSMMEVL